MNVIEDFRIVLGGFCVWRELKGLGGLRRSGFKGMRRLDWLWQFCVEVAGRNICTCRLQEAKPFSYKLGKEP